MQLRIFLSCLFLCLLPLTSIQAAQPTFPYIIKGSSEASYHPPASQEKPLAGPDGVDVVVAGGGLAGLTAALYLSDQGKKVLILEKEKKLGGLAAGGAVADSVFGRGAAYFTQAYEEEFEILKRIGLGDYQERFAIHEPSDSYFWNGKLYLGLWEEETLHELPASFALFKYALLQASEDGLIANQPMEEEERLELDSFTAAQWIRTMPAAVARLNNPEASKVYARFQSDARLDPLDPMADVLDLMELYCRSALGTTPDKVSALAFANFYVSEIETRYATPTGTGGLAQNLIKLLQARPALVKIIAAATVTDIKNTSTGATVQYVQGKKLWQVRSPYAVFALPLRFAPQLISGKDTVDKERRDLLTKMSYAHYNVHNVFVHGHPYRATYDTWTRAKDYREKDFADLIVGRWMDPVINGYQGMRDFKEHPADMDGVLSLYQPLPLQVVNGGYTKQQALQDATYSVERMLELYGPLLQKTWQSKIDIKRVETSRWPYSIHVVTPGHLTKHARLLRRPVGRVFFANNNIGTPTVEEALFRGHCAANNILARLAATFTPEPWTKCPRD